MRLTDEANKTKVGIEFEWTEEITSFDTMSINTAGVTNFSEIKGVGKFWSNEITLPSNAQGTASIKILKNSVDGVETEGPQEDRTLSFAYDTRNTTFSVASLTPQCSHRFNFADNPYMAGGGALMACWKF